ncbi:hypothetical protein [Bacillus sp. OV166]|uniref:hypothetical protein n=1 Tax=Bacillus sp. OV166 TaxID=1882763 RepID=UPI0011550CB7|nr:hypothetical protein [Bacillus sp. OV166]
MQEVYEDLSGQANVLAILEFFFDFLEQVEREARKMGIKDQSSELMKYRVLYSIWILVTYYFGYEMACSVISHSFEFNQNKLNKRAIRKIKRLLKTDSNKVEETMLKIVNDVLINISKDGHFTLLDNMYKIIKNLLRDVED